MVRFTPHQEFTVCKWTHTRFLLLCKKDMNFLGWEREKKKPNQTNQPTIPLFGWPQGLCNHPRVFSAGPFQGALYQLHLVAKRTFRTLPWGSDWAPRGQRFRFSCCHFAWASPVLHGIGLPPLMRPSTHTKETQSPMCSHGVCGTVRKPQLRRRHIARTQ